MCFSNELASRVGAATVGCVGLAQRQVRRPRRLRQPRPPWRPRGALACMLAGVLAAVLGMGTAGSSALAASLTPLAGAGAGDAPQPSWQFAGLPQQSLPRTSYRIAALDGERVLRIEAQASYGNLVHALPVGVAPRRLAWRWRLDQANAAADLRQKAGDDSAVKVCLLFDLPLSAVPFFERQLLRLARSQTAEPLPAATLCYVWDARLAPDTAIDNAYSRRVRYLVLRGPEAPLRGWLSEQRDVRVDFLRLFGDETSSLPPLLAVAVAGDADNTQGRSLAYLAGISLD